MSTNRVASIGKVALTSTVVTLVFVAIAYYLSFASWWGPFVPLILSAIGAVVAMLLSMAVVAPSRAPFFGAHQKRAMVVTTTLSLLSASLGAAWYVPQVRVMVLERGLSEDPAVIARAIDDVELSVATRACEIALSGDGRLLRRDEIMLRFSRRLELAMACIARLDGPQRAEFAEAMSYKMLTRLMDGDTAPAEFSSSLALLGAIAEKGYTSEAQVALMACALLHEDATKSKACLESTRQVDFGKVMRDAMSSVYRDELMGPLVHAAGVEEGISDERLKVASILGVNRGALRKSVFVAACDQVIAGEGPLQAIGDAFSDVVHDDHCWPSGDPRSLLVEDWEAICANLSPQWREEEQDVPHMLCEETRLHGVENAVQHARQMMTSAIRRPQVAIVEVMNRLHQDPRGDKLKREYAKLFTSSIEGQHLKSALLSQGFDIDRLLQSAEAEPVNGIGVDISAAIDNAIRIRDATPIDKLRAAGVADAPDINSPEIQKALKEVKELQKRGDASKADVPAPSWGN